MFCRAEAITMPTEDMLGDFELFPTFSTQLSGREANRDAPQVGVKGCRGQALCLLAQK